MRNVILRQLYSATKKIRRCVTIALVSLAVMSQIACLYSANESAVAEICNNADRSLVRTRGFLRLPMATDLVLTEPAPVEKYSKLIVVEKQNGTGAFVTALVASTEREEPNHVGVLPASYTYKDLHIYTSRGQTITPDDAVLVTGRILKQDTRCALEVEKIETP